LLKVPEKARPGFAFSLRLFDVASSSGIKVYGIDTDRYKSSHPRLDDRILKRDEHMTAEVKRLSGGEPYIFPVGAMHAGLATSLDAKAVFIEQGALPRREEGKPPAKFKIDPRASGKSVDTIREEMSKIRDTLYIPPIMLEPKAAPTTPSTCTFATLTCTGLAFAAAGLAVAWPFIFPGNDSGPTPEL